GWGLTLVRLLVTWEALGHKGPGLYDEEFIDYLVFVLRKAEKHGVKCFVDPHQDTMSWTFEILGAAHVHNLEEGTQPAHLVCSTMFTLFFAGHVLAPDAKYQGVNVGTFMQEKYVQCYTHLARRLKECKAVMGFEFMNEPHYGYVGLESMLRFDPYMYLHFGNFPNALRSFALGSGMEIEVDYYVKNFIGLTNKSGTRLVNSQKRSAWLNYGECVWKKHGVWDVDATGKPTVLKPNYFTTHPGTSEPLDFYQDFYMPLIRKYAAGIHSVSPDLLIFFEPIPNEDPPTLNEADRVYPNLVYAPHWYDLKALGTKSFDAKVTFDGTKNIISGMYFGQVGAERNYTDQIGNIARMGKTLVGARPILLGEVGIPMDINEKRAYATGDFKTHNQFLDLVIGSMEAHMLNFT
ncbi:glycoside hydrolase superfamily, partial [Chytriomyces sp. MP71]